MDKWLLSVCLSRPSILSWAIVSKSGLSHAGDILTLKCRFFLTCWPHEPGGGVWPLLKWIKIIFTGDLCGALWTSLIPVDFTERDDTRMVFFLVQVLDQTWLDEKPVQRLMCQEGRGGKQQFLWLTQIWLKLRRYLEKWWREREREMMQQWQEMLLTGHCSTF